MGNSIENARNDNYTLRAFQRIGYGKGLGPGVYDIHSPVVPSVEFVKNKIKDSLYCMEVGHLCVNPDCGLKTRTWPETYNFERLLYYLTNEDHDFINKSYTQMEQQQEQALSKIMLDPTTHTKLKEQFKSARITDAEMCRTLKKMYAVYKYVCDPHTSIAVA